MKSNKMYNNHTGSRNLHRQFKKIKGRFQSVFILTIFMLSCSFSSYATTITGLTFIVTTPYHPSGDLIIAGGGYLWIGSGVTVTMDPSAKISVQEDGRLQTAGTSISNVIFTSTSPTTHWLGIEILGNPVIKHQPSLYDADNGIVSPYGGATDQKGAACLLYCTIENCNYGTVLGQITTSSGNNVLKFSGSGGGTLDATHCTYQNVDYVGICLTPFNGSVPNVTSITYCTFSIPHYNYNANYMCVALFGVNMGNPLAYNGFKNLNQTGTYVLSIFGYLQYGLYAQQAGFKLLSDTMTGIYTGVQIIDVQNSFSKTINDCDFENDWWDIIATSTYNVELVINYSNKNLASWGGLTAGQANVAFAMISGDNYYLHVNGIEAWPVSGVVTGMIPTGILFPDASTPLGKVTYGNAFNDYFFGVLSQDKNFGMLFQCNHFNSTHYDISVTNPLASSSAGVLSPQGTTSHGNVNTFHTGCSGTNQWHQDPGVSSVKYYWYNTNDYPHCHSSSLVPTNSGIIGAAPCPSYAIESWNLNGSGGIKASLAAVVDSIAALPASPTLMTSAQVDLYKSFSNLRDYYLGKAIKMYVDTGYYDSAFYTMNLYPCQRANLDKINLLITLDSSYASYSTLITNISNGFSLCSDGSGYCDNIYYDSALSVQASTYYTDIMDLIKHNFSDSVLSAYHSSLVSLAGAHSYYSGCAQNILQAYHDSLWREYIPRDSAYTETILYPITWGTIDTAGGSYPIFFGNPKERPQGEWKFYPNPASSILNVTAPESLSNADPMPYRVYNELGKDVLSGMFSPGIEAKGIDIGPLAKGTYIIEITCPGNIEKYNFVKQ